MDKTIIELLQTLVRLFTEHAPETLMALFGAATSLLLFYLVWTVLRYLFGSLTRSADQEADQDQATSALMTSLVGALLSELEHLRLTLDGILQESVRRGEQNTEVLMGLLSRAEKTPGEMLQMLKPEFEQLHEAICQAEDRIVTKVAEVAEKVNGTEPEGTPSAPGDNTQHHISLS